jgi:hypothetical protein
MLEKETRTSKDFKLVVKARFLKLLVYNDAYNLYSNELVFDIIFVE